MTFRRAFVPSAASSIVQQPVQSLFRPIASVVPSYSPLAFPGRAGVIAHLGAKYDRDPQRASFLHFTDPEKLQPLGYAALVGSPHIGLTARYILPVNRPDGVEDIVEEMRRSPSSSSDGEVEDENGLFYFAWTQKSGSLVSFCEVNLLQRRKVDVGGGAALLHHRSYPRFQDSSPKSRKEVDFETKYEQECLLRSLWKVQVDHSGYSNYSRMCCVPSELGSFGVEGRPLLAVASISSVGFRLNLLDVWKGGTKVVGLNPGDKPQGRTCGCPHDLCLARSQRIVVSSNYVHAWDLRQQKLVWSSDKFKKVVNPRGYELFSIAAPPPTASNWLNSVFVGAASHVCIVDERRPDQLQLKLETVDYTRKILIRDNSLCVLHGGGLFAHDLRMLGKEGDDAHVFSELHTKIRSGSRGGDIAALPGDRFVSCVPDDDECGMAMWQLPRGGQPKVLKTAPWRAESGCFVESGFEGLSRHALAELEERVLFSMTCGFLRMSPLGRTTIAVPNSFLL